LNTQAYYISERSFERRREGCGTFRFTAFFALLMSPDIDMSTPGGRGQHSDRCWFIARIYISPPMW